MQGIPGYCRRQINSVAHGKPVSLPCTFSAERLHRHDALKSPKCLHIVITGQAR
jgi:hypothetical protein